MEAVKNLEKVMANWYKNVPHLPKNAQEWLAENVWWLALVGAILCIVGLFTYVPLLFVALGITSGLAAVYLSAANVGLFGFAWINLLVSVVSMIITGLLLLAAYRPLQTKSKKGWDYLYLSYIVSTVLSVVGGIINQSVSSVVGALIGAAIGGYFLFEIHGYFGVKKVAAKEKTTEAKAKA